MSNELALHAVVSTFLFDNNNIIICSFLLAIGRNFRGGGVMMNYDDDLNE